MQLRDYQQRALEQVQGTYKQGHKRVLLVAPTGSGKSAMMRYMLGRTNKRTLILCHRAELLDMICESLTVPYVRIGGSKRQPDAPVYVGMMQTVTRRLESLPKFDWVISDEAHLAMCPTWRSILRHYDQAWHLGLSATPCRLDGIGLGAEYERIVFGPSPRELMERGYLCRARVFAPQTVGRASKRGRGEFKMDEAAAEIDQRQITGDIIAHWRKHAEGRRTLAFACTVEHSQHLASAFNSCGIPAAHIEGDMDKTERRRIISEFRAGGIKLLVNCELLTTGFDCPEIEAGIFARPTDSLALFLQMVGRYLRPSPATGKSDAVLLDHVGNTLQHGLPDEDREWTLDGAEKRAKSAISVVQCPECFVCHRPAPKCPSCEHVYGSQSAGGGRQQPKHVDGDLQEITAQQQRLQHLRAAKLADLLKGNPDSKALREIASARGYKPRWVDHVLAARATSSQRRYGS